MKTSHLPYSPSPIIPSILTDSPQKFEQRLEFARKVGTVHVDFIDNQFCSGATLAIAEWPPLAVKYAEVHLMVTDPLAYLELIAKKGATRAVVHIESKFDLTELRNRARELDLLLGFAVNPETDLVTLKPVLDTNTYIQVMGVHPGQSGQKIVEGIAEAINYLQTSTLRPLIITVDGGVTAENIIKLRKSGAGFFVEAHTIYEGTDWPKNYQHMLGLVADKQLERTER